MMRRIEDAIAIAYLMACVKALEAMSRFAAWKARRRVRRIEQ